MPSSHPAPADRRAQSSVGADLTGIVLAREPPVRLGALIIEPPMRRVLHDDGQEQFLEPRVMQVLVALARADGKILSRDDLLAQCWNGVVVGEDAINRVMARLRRLSEGPGAGVFRIETITKVGYRLIVETSAAPPAVARAEPLLAVLAFDNLSSDPELSFFSDGVSDDIRETIARATDLKVIGRGSSFQFRGAEKSAANVAAQVKATHVLDGSVQRSGQKLRITTELVDCATETAVWSHRFERDLLDVFALQDEIASAVAGALKVAIALPTRPLGVDPATYDHYLAAREASLGFWAGLVGAFQMHQRVTDEAPTFARAWADLARTGAQLWRYHEHSRFPQVTREVIVEAARTALRLDPGLGIAYQALAELEPFNHFAAREALHEQALSHARSDPTVLDPAAIFLLGKSAGWMRRCSLPRKLRGSIRCSASPRACTPAC